MPQDPGQQEQIARIDRMQEETRTFVAEQHKLMARHTKLMPERGNLTHDIPLAPWQAAIGGMIVGAALFGAGVAFTKLVGL